MDHLSMDECNQARRPAGGPSGSSRGRLAPCFARVVGERVASWIGPHASAGPAGYRAELTEESPRPGGAGNEAVALDLRRDQHRTTADRRTRSAQAIIDANADPAPDDIEFDIPAPIRSPTGRPGARIRPGTQTWRITLNSPLPTITNTGLDRRVLPGPCGGVPFSLSQALILRRSRRIAVMGSPTGGTLHAEHRRLPCRWNDDGRFRTTPTRPRCQSCSDGDRRERANVAVAGGPAADTVVHHHVPGRVSRAQPIPDLDRRRNNLTGGTNPGRPGRSSHVGGVPLAIQPYQVRPRTSSQERQQRPGPRDHRRQPDQQRPAPVS